MHNVSTRANTIITFAITVLGVLAGACGRHMRAARFALVCIRPRPHRSLRSAAAGRAPCHHPGCPP